MCTKRLRAKIMLMASKQENVSDLLTRNVEEIIEEEHLRAALASGKKLRIKLGIDPTSPDLHLGHAIALRKLRDFQKAGHTIVLIVGDFTGRIGDPSGRTEARKPLTEKEIKNNMKHYLDQAGKILNIKKVEVAYNSQWFDKEGIEEFVKLAGATSFQQILRRADFKKRIDAGLDITFLELLYPLFQGYDSVKVKADLELGGTDQKFNLLMGRRIQRHFGIPEQDVMTLPLLEGLDGVKKMSKSVGNYISLDDAPDDMFGKIMSIPDALIEKYLNLATDLSEEEIKAIKKEKNPKVQKERLGLEVVTLYHGASAAREAKEHFEKLFSKKEIPSDIPDLMFKKGTVSALDIVLAAGAASKSEARRLIEQGAFDVNGKTERNPTASVSLKNGDVVKIGKKRFYRVKI